VISEDLNFRFWMYVDICAFESRRAGGEVVYYRSETGFGLFIL
jgi:hypothetical protein